jgi:DNA polymerase-1
MKRLILIDGNNWGFAGMANPRLSAGDRDTQAIFSVLKRIRTVYEEHPEALVMVLWDGRSWRHDIYSEYKANREKHQSQIDIKSAYLEQKTDIMLGLRLLGVTQVSASNLEADDLAEILTRNAQKNNTLVTLMTADHDWMQLVRPGVSWINLIHNQSCRSASFERDTATKDAKGYKDPAQFVDAKCVLGDAGDNIKGVMGVGPKALEALYSIYPHFDAFLYEIDTYGIEYVTDEWRKRVGKMMPKKLREIDVAATREVLAKNRRLMDLATPDRPQATGLRKDRAPLDRKAFEQFCNRNSFRSITMQLDKFIKPFEENVNNVTRSTS